ncbi:MAG TPA: GNAT family N-acetyltransferase [Burkholderiales bacterium]|nr:GNAT family N-acetyltransferase [Burkholderiales bacterium]
MPMLRTLTQSDLPGVASLFERVYPQYRWKSRPAFEGYCRDMLFANPWRDLDLPSWIAEEDDGRITGMIAVLPRPMRFRGRSIRVAVPCQFMVDPDKRNTLTALQLMKKVAAGPQDLTLADGANDMARRMWMGLGAVTPPLYNLHWVRPLRPMRYGLALLPRKALPAPIRLPAKPLAAVADAFAARLGPNRFLSEEDGLSEHPIDAGTMLEHLPELMNGHALQPNYDMRALPWLIDQTGRKARHGRLRSRAVLDTKRELLGWYLYYAKPGDVSEVVQITARKGAFDRVLQHMLADAWKQGAVAARGRLEPQHVKEFSDRHCFFRQESPSTVVYSKDPELMAAIQSGDAVLGRLEGEWWLRFQGG